MIMSMSTYITKMYTHNNRMTMYTYVHVPVSVCVTQEVNTWNTLTKIKDNILYACTLECVYVRL